MQQLTDESLWIEFESWLEPILERLAGIVVVKVSLKALATAKFREDIKAIVVPVQTSIIR